MYKMLTRKAVKSKESLINCHGQEEPKEPWLLSGIKYPGWDPGIK